MKKVNIFYILGTALIAFSLVLLVVNQRQTAQKSEYITHITRQVQQIIPPHTPAVAEQYTDTQMPVCDIEGVDYCALIQCTKLGITLPVADNPHSTDILPARCYGSVYDKTMIIGGGSLDFVTQLDTGDEITVVDMLGGEYTYHVDRIDRAKEVDGQRLASRHSRLTIFTYIAKENKYIVVRCSD